MKLLQVSAAYIPAYIYGGPTMSVAMLCEQLVLANCEVSMFTTTANGETELEVIPNETLTVNGVSVTYFKRITKDHTHFSPALLTSVWKYAKNYDVIHIHAWWNLVSVLSCLIGVLRGVPVIISPRGTLSPYSFKNKKKLLKLLIHNLLSKPLMRHCTVHATSKREGDAVNCLITSKNTFTIPNFIKLPGYQQSALREISSPLKLIFFSRIEEKKGLDMLLNALVTVKIPYHLTVAGNGNEAYIAGLKKLANNNGLADKISWIGFVNENKFDVLYQHDLFILPSYDENFGNAVIESLSVGTAVLISEEVGLASYVENAGLGWVCQLNVQAISQAINDIGIADLQELLRIRKEGPEIIYNDFENGALTKKYLDMYSKITSND